MHVSTHVSRFRGNGMLIICWRLRVEDGGWHPAGLRASPADGPRGNAVSPPSTNFARLNSLAWCWDQLPPELSRVVWGEAKYLHPQTAPWVWHISDPFNTVWDIQRGSSSALHILSSDVPRAIALRKQQLTQYVKSCVWDRQRLLGPRNDGFRYALAHKTRTQWSWNGWAKMGKLKWGARTALNSPKASAFRRLSVGFSCYPFSLIRFGATEKHMFLEIGVHISETPDMLSMNALYTTCILGAPWAHWEEFKTYITLTPSLNQCLSDTLIDTSNLCLDLVVQPGSQPASQLASRSRPPYWYPRLTDAWRCENR